jgi:hypothetical protein
MLGVLEHQHLSQHQCFSLDQDYWVLHTFLEVGGDPNANSD